MGLLLDSLPRDAKQLPGDKLRPLLVKQAQLFFACGGVVDLHAFCDLTIPEQAALKAAYKYVETERICRAALAQQSEFDRVAVLAEIDDGAAYDEHQLIKAVEQCKT